METMYWSTNWIYYTILIHLVIVYITLEGAKRYCFLSPTVGLSLNRNRSKKSVDGNYVLIYQLNLLYYSITPGNRSYYTRRSKTWLLSIPYSRTVTESKSVKKIGWRKLCIDLPNWIYYTILIHLVIVYITLEGAKRYCFLSPTVGLSLNRNRSKKSVDGNYVLIYPVEFTILF